jgi:hypothetical protein
MWHGDLSLQLPLCLAVPDTPPYSPEPIQSLDTSAGRMVTSARRADVPKKASPPKTARGRRRVRTQSILFTALGLIIVASFVLSMLQ